jgi:molybdate transport system ATP-binding protein
MEIGVEADGSARGEIMVARAGSDDARPLVTLDDVSLHPSRQASLPPVRWEILSNQHWAVVGPTGCGKSVLVKALGGRLPIAGGRIVYHLRNGASRNGSGQGSSPQGHIAYVDFDLQRALLGHQTPFYQARWNSLGSEDAPTVSDYLSETAVKGLNPYQVVDTPSDPVGFSAQQDRVAELLGIEPLLERKLMQISSGERRKVLLARALLQNPELLILDNPFAGLDQDYRAGLKSIMSGLMQGAMRVMVVTTSWNDIPPGVTHVLLIGRDGAIAQGPRKTVLSSLPLRGTADRDDRSEQAVPCLAQEQRSGEETERQVLVHMDGVNVSYNGVRVLCQVDWTIRQGEHWALLGPNGAGKTTLLSLILGDNPQAYANKIVLFGRRRGSGESIWDIKQRIGWVAPELQLYYPRGASCLDVVCSGFFDSVGLYRRCPPEYAESALQWMEYLGTAQLAGVPFHAVSEGQQRLVLMARAVVKNPPLLILDEPCQGLDAEHRDRVLKMVDAIGGRLATSVIYVTHEPDALPAIINRVLRLDEGRVAGKGGGRGEHFCNGVEMKEDSDWTKVG